MGVYGLNSLNEVFEGKVPGLKIRSVRDIPPAVSLPKAAGATSPLGRSLGLFEKRSLIEEKVFGKFKGKGLMFESSLGSKGKGLMFESSLGSKGKGLMFESSLGSKGKGLLFEQKLGSKLGARRAVGFEEALFGSVNRNTEKLGWNRMKAQRGLSMFGDQDKDGTPNVFDCDPWDRKKQAVIDQALPGDTVRYGAPPEDVAAYQRDQYDFTPASQPESKKGVISGIWQTAKGKVVSDLERFGVIETPESRQAKQFQQMSKGILRANVARDIAQQQTLYESEKMRQDELRRQGVPFFVIDGKSYTEYEARQLGLLGTRGGYTSGGSGEVIEVGGKQYTLGKGNKLKAVRGGVGGFGPRLPSSVQYVNQPPISGMERVWRGATSALPPVSQQTVAEGLAVTGGGWGSLGQAAALPQQTDSYRNKVIALVGTQRQKEQLGLSMATNPLMPGMAPMPVIPSGSAPPRQKVARAEYEGPVGNPPASGMTWSPYSKRWVRYPRGPYRK